MPTGVASLSALIPEGSWKRRKAIVCKKSESARKQSVFWICRVLKRRLLCIKSASQYGSGDGSGWIRRNASSDLTRNADRRFPERDAATCASDPLNSKTLPARERLNCILLPHLAPVNSYYRGLNMETSLMMIRQGCQENRPLV